MIWWQVFLIVCLIFVSIFGASTAKMLWNDDSSDWRPAVSLVVIIGVMATLTTAIVIAIEIKP